MFRKIVSNLSFSPALAHQLGFYAKRLRKEQVTRRLGLIFVALALVVQSLVVFQPSESANASSSGDFVPGGLGLGANKSLDNFLRPYDANTNNLKDIMNYTGITRQEIAAAQFGYWMTPGTLSWGRQPRFSAAQGEQAVTIKGATGNFITTVYARPMTLANGVDSIYGWIGNSQKAGWFAIMQYCGNLVTKNIPPPPLPPPPPPPPVPVPTASCTVLTGKIVSRKQFELNATAATAYGATVSKYTFTVKNSAGATVFNKSVASTQLNASSGTFSLNDVGTYTAKVEVTTSVGVKIATSCITRLTVVPPDKCPLNASLTVEDKNCQPCPGKATIWFKDADCEAKVIQTKSAINLSQGSVDATTVTAGQSDQIRYSITVENIGLLTQAVTLDEKLEDVLEYATIVDNGGGTFNASTKTLSWPSIDLKAGEKQVRVFTVKLLDTIPATAKGQSEAASYDCTMINVFGNSVSIKVDCPGPKVVENVVTQLPTTGPTENMIFAGIVVSVVTYFYLRSRQVNKEVRLIRRNLNSGTI